ncbi:hypothetical protein VPH35_074133 [Triticum aestivum]
MKDGAHVARVACILDTANHGGSHCTCCHVSWAPPTRVLPLRVALYPGRRRPRGLPLHVLLFVHRSFCERMAMARMRRELVRPRRRRGIPGEQGDIHFVLFCVYCGLLMGRSVASFHCE